MADAPFLHAILAGAVRRIIPAGNRPSMAPVVGNIGNASDNVHAWPGSARKCAQALPWQPPPRHGS